ncbi:MAG: hypothetical protein IJC48_05675 [Clostridia bacterium]|nr:hypothetical protein [Clostridia bacterium]
MLKGIQAVQTQAPAVECNCNENKSTASRLLRNGERVSTGNAAKLRKNHRQECAGEIAKCRNGKDRLQESVCGILPLGENRVFAEDSYKDHSVRLHAQAVIRPCAGSMCRENLHFIKLPDGQCAPDHNTFNLCRRNILTQAAGHDILTAAGFAVESEWTFETGSCFYRRNQD